MELSQPFFITKLNSISYSQFLQSYKHIHHITEQTNSFLDTEFFKRSISLHYQYVYNSQKKQNWVYKFIFYGLSFLFLILGLIIFSKTTNAMCGFYFSHYSTVVKNCINGCCLLFAGGTFTFGYMLHPEKDAIRYLVHKVEKEITSSTQHLQVEFNAIFKDFSHQWNSLNKNRL